MRQLSTFVCAVIVCVMANLAAIAAAGDSDRLVGTWRQHVGNENIVKFGADKSVTLYLRKGEVGNLHTMDGTWELADDGTITMTFTVNGQSFSRAAKLSFEGDEMVLTDDRGDRTRHVRFSGPLPAWAVW